MRYLHHDAGTVAGLVARLSAAVLHVLQYTQRIVNQLVTLSSMYVHHHAYSTGIVLITALIKSTLFFNTRCHIILTFTFCFLVFGCKIIQIV